MGSAPHLLSISVLLAAASCNLFALDPSLELSQFSHSSWSYSTGFISGRISAIAQTRDGYLWMGTNEGLYRYDGVRFQPLISPVDHSPLRLDVRSLMGARDGSLWIGTASGIRRIPNSRSPALAIFPGRIPAGPVTTLLEDNQGVVWASLKGSLIRIAGHLVQVYSAPQGLPPQVTENLFADSRHRLWVATTTGACQINAPSGIRCEAGDHKFLAISELPDHRLVVSDTSGTLLAFDGEHLEPLSHERFTILPRTMIADDKGVVWFASVGHGLTRLRGTTIDSFGRRQGLTGELITAVFEDREGDLWIATTGGLDRLSDSPLPRLTVFEGLSGDVITALSPSAGGAMWVGTVGAGIDRVLGRSTTNYDQKSGLPRLTIEALLEDSSHRLWVATPGGLVRGDNGHFTPVKNDRGQVLTRVLSLAEGGGAVWILNDLSELYRSVDGQLLPVPLDAAVTRDKDLYHVISAPDGTIWLSHYSGAVTRLAGGVATTLHIPDAQPGTPVTALYASREGSLWAGSAGGLHRLHNHHWSFYPSKLWRNEPVLGVVEDTRGKIWIATSNILARLTFSKDHPDRDPAVAIIGGGLHLGDQGRLGGPRMTVSRGGQIWVATDEGVVVVDQNHPPASEKSPVAPAIETVSVDGHPLTLSAAGDAEFRGREVSFEYTLPEMGQPEAIRFRYTMKGFQKEWLDAGTRRQTAYANMGPGHYQFCVIAALPGQAWDGPMTCQALEVLPYFYQTWWFMIVCMIGSLALVAGAYQLRIQQMRDRFKLVTRERMRVARELHDTLLQGFAGVTYKLEVVSRQMIGAPEPSKKKLDVAIIEAEASLVDARNAIQFLRLEALEHGEISEALASVCRGLAENSGASVKVVVEDGIRGLSPEIEGTLYMIAREAVLNAVRHAQARHITVTVSRRNGGGPTLIIEDDGQGFDTEEGFAKDSHYGIRGMRERAKEIVAVFNVTSAPGQGTRIEVRFPRTRL